MNRGDIIRMARGASEETNWKPALGNEHVVEFLERFFHAAYAAGAAAEREACAKACEDAWTRHQCAAAIRARSNT